MAGRYDYWADRDIGALILEHVADSMTQSVRRAALYRHARYRAEWCAAAATAAGEGMARSRHVEQLAQKLKAEPGASPNGGPAESLGNSGAGGGPPSVSYMTVGQRKRSPRRR
jgi:hypothetical protein